MGISPYEAMQDALEICGDLGFEMVPGFSTHWAMASETLIQLGRPDVVHTWATLYPERRKHVPMPDHVAPIDDEDETSWRAALGDFRRASDWRAYFERQVKEQPWRSVLHRWWARLLPGMGSGLTHGMLRTTHAVRSFSFSNSGAPSALQLRELAAGLGYWASLYVEQPGPLTLTGSARLPEILATIPRLSGEVKIGTREKGLFHHMNDVPGWVEAAASLASPVNIEEALSDLTLAHAQVNLVHDKTFPIPIAHNVTAPAAIRLMLPHLPTELHLPSYIAVWKATSAILTNFAAALPGEVALSAPGGEADTLSPEELKTHAVEHGDEHAIKFTEACLREYAIRPDIRYLLAPTRLMPRLLRYFR